MPTGLKAVGGVMSSRIQIDRDRVADFCPEPNIRKLALFGSALTDEFRPESDIDVLGRKVDLRIAAELSRYFRDSVLATSGIQYAEDGRASSARI
jgi:uncharacterized protein